jgi:hypothetical protein
MDFDLLFEGFVQIQWWLFLIQISFCISVFVVTTVTCEPDELPQMHIVAKMFLRPCYSSLYAVFCHFDAENISFVLAGSIHQQDLLYLDISSAHACKLGKY